MIFVHPDTLPVCVSLLLDYPPPPSSFIPSLTLSPPLLPSPSLSSLSFTYEMVMMLRTKTSPTMSLLEEWELREGNAATLDSLIVMMEELENASALQVLQQVKGLCVHVGFNLFLFTFFLFPSFPFSSFLSFFFPFSFSYRVSY